MGYVIRVFTRLCASYWRTLAALPLSSYSEACQILNPSQTTYARVFWICTAHNPPILRSRYSIVTLGVKHVFYRNPAKQPTCVRLSDRCRPSFCEMYTASSFRAFGSVPMVWCTKEYFPKGRRWTPRSWWTKSKKRTKVSRLSSRPTSRRCSITNREVFYVIV